MEETKEQLEKRIEDALELSAESMDVTGEHHKVWFLDQIVRVLTGDKYEETIEKLGNGNWDEGIQP